jgi:hypothetical protein
MMATLEMRVFHLRDDWGQILSTWLGDIVYRGIWLSYRPVSRYSLAAVRQPYAIVDYTLQSWTKNLASGFKTASFRSVDMYMNVTH